MIGIHYDSIKLRLCADAMFVAIFGVLESLVNELSKSSLFSTCHSDNIWAMHPANGLIEKGLALMTNGDTYGGKVASAISALDSAVANFKEEAALCDSKRLGRVGEEVSSTRLTVEDTAVKLDCETAHHFRTTTIHVESTLTME